LKRFRLVNKAFSNTLERYFWDTQTLVLNLNREELSVGMGMLEDLKNRCRASGFVRAMVIESLAPQRATRYEVLKDYKGFKGLEGPELAKVKAACEILPKLLPEALSALTQLRRME